MAPEGIETCSQGIREDFRQVSEEFRRASKSIQSHTYLLYSGSTPELPAGPRDMVVFQDKGAPI